MIETFQKQAENVYILKPIFDRSEGASAEEIRALVESAGGKVCGIKTQVVREVNPATFIGSGKLEEIKEELSDSPADLIVFDGELSPSQTLNIRAALGVDVIDRTTLILDIFALNAKSTEGKLQVELAQLKYIYPRLRGKGAELSRQGGGIGTRGPGETQLESDRRHIRRRIDFLENGEIYIGQLSKMIGSQSVSAFKKQQQRMMHKAPELLENTGKELPKIEGGQKVDTGVDICPPKIELELELEKEIEIEKEGEKEKDNTSDAFASDPAPYSKIQSLFNELCPSLPKVMKMTEARKKAIKARWIEYGKDINVFVRLFKETESTPFMKGENSRNWRASFDWLMKPDKMARTLEGNYRNRGDMDHADTNATSGAGTGTGAVGSDQRAITTAELEEKLRKEGSFKGYPDFDAMFKD